MKEKMVNYFYLPFVFSAVFCLLVASFESLEISAPDNVFRCLMYLVMSGRQLQTNANDSKRHLNPKDHTKSKT